MCKSILILSLAIFCTAPFALGSEEITFPETLPEADAHPHTDWISRFTIDNDAPYFSPFTFSDRHYTNRFELSFVARPEWAWDLGDWLPPAEGTEVACAGGFVFGQTIVTPDDITQTAPQPMDMPFAGYLFVGGFWQRDSTLSPTTRHLEQIEIDMGVLGPSARGYETQKTVHEIFTGRDNPGWVNERLDEPAVQFSLRHKWNMIPEAFALDSPPGQLRLEFIPEIGFAAGTIRTQLEGGMTVRYGWNLPRDFGPVRTDDPSGPNPRPLGHSLYLFGRTLGQVVAHDTFTDGSLIRSAPTTAASGIHGESLRYANSLGIEWSWRGRGNWDFDFGWCLNFYSKLYKEQPDTDGTGQFTLSFKHEF